MFKLLKAYQKMDPAARNLWEVFFLYPGIKAIFFHRIAHLLYAYKIPFLPRMISEFSRFLTGIELHPGATIGKECVLDHGMGIVIGETAVVGDRVLIYQGVTLGGVKLTQDKRHPTIEDEVVLGSGSKILGNITIGKHARVGANAVVLRSVSANMIVAGIPAQVIAKSASEYCESTWDYSI